MCCGKVAQFMTPSRMWLICRRFGMDLADSVRYVEIVIPEVIPIYSLGFGGVGLFMAYSRQRQGIQAKRVNVTTETIMTFMMVALMTDVSNHESKLYFSPCHHYVIIYFHNGWGNVSEMFSAAVTSQLLSCKAKSLWQLCCSLRLQTWHPSCISLVCFLLSIINVDSFSLYMLMIWFTVQWFTSFNTMFY